MPWVNRYACSDCGHGWTKLESGSTHRVGSIDTSQPDTFRTYCCPRCHEDVCVPRQLERNSWERWLAAHADDVQQQPLVAGTCQRITDILSQARSKYAPVEIDLSLVTCGKCQSPMQPSFIRELPIICPKCGSQTAKSLGADVHVCISVHER